jgi:hypothetical protein
VARKLLLENGDFILLESGTGDLLLEGVDLATPIIVAGSTLVASNVVCSAIAVAVSQTIVGATTLVDPTVRPNVVTAIPDSLVAAGVLVAPNIQGGGAVVVTMPEIISTALLLPPRISGPVVLTPDVIVAAVSLGNPTIANSTRVDTTTITAVSALVAPTVLKAAYSLSPNVMVATAQLLTPDVLTGEILTPTVLLSAASLVSPTVVRGAVVYTPDILSATAILVPPTIVNPTNLMPNVITSFTQLVKPTVSLSANTLVVDAAILSITTALLPPQAVTAGKTAIIDASTAIISADAILVVPTFNLHLRMSAPVLVLQTELIPPNVGIGDAVHTLSPEGRKQITVDQQQGGEDYPFISPSDNLQLLIGDLYLAYNDNHCQFSLPLQISWLRGFGTEAAVDPVGAVAGNEYVIQITDADAVVVFDSRDSVAFKLSNWGNGTTDYRRVLEWLDASGQILRLVLFTAWESEDVAVDWPIYFEPQNAQLVSRVLDRLPPRVTSLALVNDLADASLDTAIVGGTNVLLQNGYNSKLEKLDTVENSLNADGSLLTRIIRLSMEAGTGLGRYACEPDLLVKRINGVNASERGNIVVDAGNCYRCERPITNINEETREADVVKSTLHISNDCGPCCSCEDFMAVYEAIRQSSNRYRTLGMRAEAVRDQLRANIARWQKAGDCRKQANVQAVAEAFAGCKVAFGVGICNNSDSPLRDVTLKVSFEYGPDSSGVTATSSVTGCIICNSTTRLGNILLGGTKRPGSTAYNLEGSWPEFTIHFDCINPGTLGSVNWVMQFAGCSNSDVIEFVVSGGTKIIKTQVTLKDLSEDTCCELSSESI